MAEDPVNLYEGLFLFSQTDASNLRATIDHLREILTSSHAEIVSLRKWDERRLAYQIRGNKRGVYFLVYFQARGSVLIAIERAGNLSEKILRSIIVRADHLTLEQVRSADRTRELEEQMRQRAGDSEKAGPSGRTGEPEEPPKEVEVNVKVETGADAATTSEA